MYEPLDLRELAGWAHRRIKKLLAFILREQPPCLIINNRYSRRYYGVYEIIYRRTYHGKELHAYVLHRAQMVPSSAHDFQKKNSEAEDVRFLRKFPQNHVFRRHVPSVDSLRSRLIFTAALECDRRDKKV